MEVMDLKRLLRELRAHPPDFTNAERQATAQLIEMLWPDSTLEEAQVLVKIMKIVPSTAWFTVMYKAEHKDMAHWELLLKHGDALYERAADAAADEDGLTTAMPR
jgi:hypothetical protein